jgi:hypothetical protein
MIRTPRDKAHDRLDQLLNIRDRNLPGFSVAWKATRIEGSRYAHDHSVFQRLEAGDPAPRFAVDDVLDGEFEDPEDYEPEEHIPSRDRVEGRNRRGFSTCEGRISGQMRGGRASIAGRIVAMDSVEVAMDALESLPLERISETTDRKLGEVADCLRSRLAGKVLNPVQRGFVERLKTYLAGKSSIEQCSMLRLTDLLRGIATA